MPDMTLGLWEREAKKVPYFFPRTEKTQESKEGREVLEEVEAAECGWLGETWLMRNCQNTNSHHRHGTSHSHPSAFTCSSSSCPASRSGVMAGCTDRWYTHLDHESQYSGGNAVTSVPGDFCLHLCSSTLPPIPTPLPLPSLPSCARMLSSSGNQRVEGETTVQPKEGAV